MMDVLLESLVLLSRAVGAPASRDQLADGLPLSDGRLTPELIPRAASRAGLSARVVRTPLARIPEAWLPCALLLRDGRACVLVRRNGGSAEVLLPESGGGVAELGAADLAALYAGEAIFARPAPEAADAGEARIPESRGWLWRGLARAWPGWGQVLVASVLINAFALALPLFSMNVYDRVVPAQALETLWALAIGLAVVFAFDFLLRLLRAWFVDGAAREFDADVSARLFERVLGMRLEHRPPAAGALASQLREFEGLRDALASVTLLALVDLPFAALFLLAVAWLGGWLVLVPLGGLAVVLGVGLAAEWPLLRAVRRAQAELARRQALAVEAINGLEAVKALGASGQLQLRWEAAVEAGAAASMRARVLSGLGVSTALLCTGAATAGVIVLGVHEIVAGRLTVGALVACSILTGRALAPAAQLAAAATRLGHGLAAARAVGALLATPAERPAGASWLERPDLAPSLELAEVSFAYPGQPAPVLDGLSLAIAAGERVAIIGRNGSGKSTIARLLLTFYAPQRGRVLLGGADVRQLDPAWLRRRIGYVPQDVVLFAGSVRDNVAFGAPQVDEAAVLEAAEAAGLDELFRRAPAGLGQPVGERGQLLSGGQRQAVGLARALLLRPPILVLDEPTSAMDATAEAAFKARLGALAPGRTLVLITHRFPLLELVSRVVVIDGGRVVADGPREQILQALAQGRVRGTAGGRT